MDNDLAPSEGVAPAAAGSVYEPPSITALGSIRDLVADSGQTTPDALGDPGPAQG